MSDFSPPRKLTAADEVDEFSCGERALDEWLQRYALVNQRAGLATVFVITSGGRVVGYYALVAGGVERDHVPHRVARGLPAHPIPVVLLARLAVDRPFQGNGLGRALLRDALIRVAAAADVVGVRALLIHAKDDGAREYYLRQAEFESSPTDPLHLFLLLKDLRKSLGDAAGQ